MCINNHAFCFSLCQHLNRPVVLLAELNVIFAPTLSANQRVTGSIFHLLRYMDELLFSERRFSRCHFKSHLLQFSLLLFYTQQVVLTASDLPGYWYAVNTLLQILRLFHGTGIPQVQVNMVTFLIISLFFLHFWSGYLL